MAPQVGPQVGPQAGRFQGAAVSSVTDYMSGPGLAPHISHTYAWGVHNILLSFPLACVRQAMCIAGVD